MFSFISFSHVVEGKINEQEISVVLDSGACISIVPKSLVKDSQYTNETVTIVGCTKDKYVVNIAVVSFQFGDWEMTKEVAVTPDEMLSGCALYSFKLLDDSDMKLTEFIKAKKDAIAKETANAPTLQERRTELREKSKSKWTSSNKKTKLSLHQQRY